MDHINQRAQVKQKAGPAATNGADDVPGIKVSLFCSGWMILSTSFSLFVNKQSTQHSQGALTVCVYVFMLSLSLRSYNCYVDF